MPVSSHQFDHFVTPESPRKTLRLIPPPPVSIIRSAKFRRSSPQYFAPPVVRAVCIQHRFFSSPGSLSRPLNVKRKLWLARVPPTVRSLEVYSLASGNCSATSFALRGPSDPTTFENSASDRSRRS